MSAAGEDFQLTESGRHERVIHASQLSTTMWLGRKDSNLRIRDPKSRALPLGHAPTLFNPGAPALGTALRAWWGPSPHSALRATATDFTPALSGRSGPREWPIS